MPCLALGSITRATRCAAIRVCGCGGSGSRVVVFGALFGADGSDLVVALGALFGADGSDLVVVFGTMRSCSGVREATSLGLRGRSEADDDVTGGGDVLGAVPRA